MGRVCAPPPDMFMVVAFWRFPSKNVFHGLSSDRVTRRFMWAFIKRTSVLSANHLVNMPASICILIQNGTGKIRIFAGFFPQPGLSRLSGLPGPTKANLTCLFIFPPVAKNVGICCLCTKIMYNRTHIFLLFFWSYVCVCSGLICWHYCHEVGGIVFAFWAWLLWLTSADWQRISLPFCLVSFRCGPIFAFA